MMLTKLIPLVNVCINNNIVILEMGIYILHNFFFSISGISKVGTTTTGIKVLDYSLWSRLKKMVSIIKVDINQFNEKSNFFLGSEDERFIHPTWVDRCSNIQGKVSHHGG